METEEIRFVKRIVESHQNEKRLCLALSKTIAQPQIHVTQVKMSQISSSSLDLVFLHSKTVCSSARVLIAGDLCSKVAKVNNTSAIEE